MPLGRSSRLNRPWARTAYRIGQLAEVAVGSVAGWQTVRSNYRGGDVTEQRIDDQHEPVHRRDLDDLARAKDLKPVASLEDLKRFALDVWDSDEDLEAFLADVRASRNADVA